MAVNGQVYDPAALPQWKYTSVPVDRRLGGPQSRSRRCGIEKNLFPLPEIEPRLSSPSLYRGRYFKIDFDNLSSEISSRYSIHACLLWFSHEKYRLQLLGITYCFTVQGISIKMEAPDSFETLITIHQTIFSRVGWYA
jgi:hypothetical protein